MSIRFASALSAVALAATLSTPAFAGETETAAPAIQQETVAEDESAATLRNMVLADPATPPALRTHLAQAQQTALFAADLALVRERLGEV
mgnify:CR=1 FL=1